MAEAKAAELGVEIAARLGPMGLKWIWRRLRGKVILVVGAPEVGKTTFIEYLCWDVFRSERYTSRTIHIEKTPGFDLEMGHNTMFTISIRMMVDFPGNIGAVLQADEVFERNPHAIIIFTDLTDSATKPVDAPGIWLRDFCRHLETLWRRDGRKRRNRIKVMIVVMNKSDKIKDMQILKDRQDLLQRIIDTELRDARGRMIEEITVMPCALVPNPKQEEEAQNIILHLAKGLRKQ